MFTVYIVISAALLPVLDRFWGILRLPCSWWLVPLLFVGSFLALVLLHLLIVIVSVWLVDVNKPADRFANYYRFLIKHTIPLVLKLVRVKVNAEGTDQVPTDRKMLFVCNHQHDFDPVIMLSVFSDHEMGFIGKKEIYQKMPLVGKIMHKLHSLPIDRENDREAAKTVIQAARLLKEEKASMGLFPEGYTNIHCDEVLLLPFRNGAFKIAYRGDAPIVVCVIDNTRAIPKRLFLHKTEIAFRVLGVIQPEEYKSMNTAELGNLIHGQMEEALQKIRDAGKPGTEQ